MPGVIAANAEIDREASGFFINFTIDEGARYTFGGVEIQSSLPGVLPDSLYGNLLTQSGDTYNGADIDKTVERLTLVVAEQGYAFVRVRPRAIPDPVNRTISVIYLIEEGPRILHRAHQHRWQRTHKGLCDPPRVPLG